MHAASMSPTTRKLRPTFKLKVKGTNLVRGLLSNVSPTRKLRPGRHMEIVKEKGKQVQTAILAFKPCPFMEENDASSDEDDES
jgi:hypothetical protein